MTIKNYSRISSSRRAEEKESWASQVSSFAKAVDETIKSRQPEKKGSRTPNFIPVSCKSETYCSE